MDPKDKVAVITGSASGIGLVTAKLLAQNGARIVGADTNEEAGRKAVRDLEATGAEARFIRTDVTQRSDQEAMLEFAQEQFGGADIFFNNAGISEGGAFYTLDSDAWTPTLAIDLEAVILGTQLQIHFLRKRGGGVIINTASMGGIVPMAGSPVYAASKAGVIHFCRSLAHLAAENIRVNAICPTFTETPLFMAGGEAAVEMAKREVGGLLQPETVAEGVLQLIQDDSQAGAVMRATVRKGLDYTFKPRTG